jgi:hypothetical protein
MGSHIGNRSRNPFNKKLILTPGDANSGVERSAVEDTDDIAFNNADDFSDLDSVDDDANATIYR